MTRRALAVALIAATGLYAPAAMTHGDKQQRIDHSKVDEKPFGRAADPKKAKRTIRVDMSDTMRFSPAELTVGKDDTVRFIVSNSGKQMHEMVLGTMKELKEHAELMKKHPGMEHDEPYMAHVQPGRKAQIVWQFTKPGEFHYGCLIPGHFEAGMVGKVRVAQ